jgi:ADP-ribose pyrophosphatase YjhB (NUDIX family)
MEGSDCAFQSGGGRFRYRVGAIILEDGCVLMVKNEAEPYCYSVGGAVKLGESAEQAAAREAFEETGMQYEVDRLQYVHENFFSSEGTPFHEITLYFLMKPRGVKTFEPAAPTEFGGVERMVWIPIRDYQNHHAYPTFFCERLRNIGDRVEHITTREQETP